MDLNELKNLNMDDLKAKILAFADKKTLIKIGISLGSIIIFLTIYYAILNPIVEKKRNQITDMNNKQEEISKFNKDVDIKFDNSSSIILFFKLSLIVLCGIPELFKWSIKSSVEIFVLFIFAIVFVFPLLNILPIPQKTKGIIIIKTKIPAYLVFAKFLKLLIIIYKFIDL